MAAISARLASVVAKRSAAARDWSGRRMPPRAATNDCSPCSLVFIVRLMSASCCSRNSRETRASSMLNDRVRAMSASMYVLAISTETWGREASAASVTIPLLSGQGWNVTRARCSSASAAREGFGAGGSTPRQRM